MRSWYHNSIPSDSIWLIRHAERQKRDPGTYGNDLHLTERGHKEALHLGKSLSKTSLKAVHSSPILRCMQTSEAIVQGVNQRLPIFQSHLLGDPGAFISDAELAGPYFLNNTIEEIAEKIVSGKPLPGMRLLSEGGQLLLDYIIQLPFEPTLIVSHDLIICLFCCYLFNSNEIAHYLPDFLEGLTLTRKNKGLLARYGSHVREFTLA